jgi:hypothetical protein
MKNFIFAFALTLIAFSNLFAQKTVKKELLYSNRFSILAGMIQPTALGGGNFEVNYFTKKMAFDYSHGFSLEPPVVGDFKDQKVVLYLPFTTGFGVGYRFNSFLDLRFEPKLHRWQIFQKGEKQIKENKIADFKTFSLGLGLYYRYFPFRNSENKFLQGITTSSSVRYWQNVGSDLSGDKFSYANKISGKTETLDAPNIGIANTPIVINVAIGYTFGGK